MLDSLFANARCSICYSLTGGAEDRDALRYERHKDRARERNLARAAPDKRNKLSRDKERDISEKIALGMPSASTSGGDTQFDSRSGFSRCA